MLIRLLNGIGSSVSLTKKDYLTNDSGLSVPGPMSRPYQPIHGAASRFFPWKR